MLQPDLYTAARKMCDALISTYDIKALKTVDYYQRTITNDVHALYSRALSRRDFVGDMSRVIDNQLTEAWNTGADEMMVLPEDMTEEDKSYLQEIIDSEISHLDGLADDIQQAQSDQVGWEQFSYRVDLWTNRYLDTVNQARLYFGDKERLIWNLGSAEVHCHTGDNGKPGIGCADLNGIVLFAYEWEQVGIRPQSSLTNCQGWNCTCELVPTSERRTYGGLSKVMDMMVSANI